MAKRPTFQKVLNQLRVDLNRKFVDIYSFNSAVDASIGALLDLCYQKGLFTEEEFQSTTTIILKKQVLRRTLSESASIEDLDQAAKRIASVLVEVGDAVSFNDLDLKVAFGDNAEEVHEKIIQEVDRLKLEKLP